MVKKKYSFKMSKELFAMVARELKRIDKEFTVKSSLVMLYYTLTRFDRELSLVFMNEDESRNDSIEYVGIDSFSESIKNYIPRDEKLIDIEVSESIFKRIKISDKIKWMKLFLLEKTGKKIDNNLLITSAGELWCKILIKHKEKKSIFFLNIEKEEDDEIEKLIDLDDFFNLDFNL